MISFVGNVDTTVTTTQVPYSLLDSDGTVSTPSAHTADLYDDEFGTAVQTSLTITTEITGALYTVAITGSWLTPGKMYTIVAAYTSSGAKKSIVTFMAY